MWFDRMRPAGRAFALGLGELGDQVGERDEVNEFARTDRLDGERSGEMALAGAGWPEQVDNLCARNEVQA